MEDPIESLVFDENGLIPVIVQDAESGEVLMLAFANEEAVEKTVETGFAHFFSRSRRTLWKKGETSGNTLGVVSIRFDCDSDGLLYRV
ncbi:MAG: bifunctional phosphoribosyl-AMP cyclohydrolase/phosphoribosyl-ATP diphosphatase, partial [Nitrospirae bacterium]|nr:bifunctional phosphoribosyl-AMP cyclohydrolase/phosphoribosyl-ATP diphosphatase [Nitrospirota bacterium]